MDLILRDGQAVAHKDFYGIRCILNPEREVPALIGSEVAQHIVRGVLASWGTAHTHADSLVVLRAQ